ncbi:MAG TPA: LuxR C-terminal-related transcriptional regulator [Thermoanaerobaculia bacterium]|nr:LuxR C-terminal-related transcriptional regulator [Thermoanaerobaculia bacterium]
MGAPARSRGLEAGHEALARGAWEFARKAFERALAQEESPEALEGLGLASWWLDRGETVFEARERAYALYRERGDRVSAARVAVWLGWDYAAFRGESAVASGWLGRARRLLEGLPDGPEHAWLALREGVFALLEESDPERALERANEAIRVGAAISSPDHEMVGRALAGFAKVTAGNVAEGMRDLDEVNAAVVAGELSNFALIGLASCYLIAACERIRDYDRALQWCSRLKELCRKWGLRPLFAVCRTQYASVCMWNGTWDEADRELTLATEELAASRPAMTAEGLVRLADLRRRQGRLEEAEEMFARSEPHPQASLGRAELALARGEAAAATDLADRYLRRLPSHNRVERAEGLELAVRSRLAVGKREEARAAFDELSAIASAVGTLALLASERLAAGFLASEEGDLESARRDFEDAVDRFQQGGAPYETARARVELARALARLGRAEDARREAERAIELLRGMGAEGEIRRARDVLSEAGAAAAGERSPGAKLTSREIEVLALVAKGLSNADIGERLFVSEHTVHRHVANILAKLNVPSRAAAVAEAGRLKLL